LLSEQDLEALSKSEVDLEAYERAKQDLLKLHYLHDDVAEALKSKKGGLFNPIANGGLFNPIDGGDAEGGLFNPIDGGVVGGLKLDKRVKRRQDLKKALIKDFNDRLAQLINIVLNASKHVAIALGDGKQEMSDAVQKFVKALESLPSLQNQYTYFCLTGAVDDIRAREEREKFISSCKYIISTIDELLKENKSGHLKDMRDAFSRIIELIHGYVAKFAEGFGPLESWESYNKKVQGAEDGAAEGAGFMSFLGLSPEQKVQAKKVTSALKDTARGVGVAAAQIAADAVSKGVQQGLSKASASGMGEGFESFIGGASTASYARIASSLDDAIRTITYFHRIAVMRRGLDKASKEFKSYKDDYVKILADAIAKERDENAEGKKVFLQAFERKAADGTTNNPLYAEFIQGLTPAQLAAAEPAFDKSRAFAASLYDSVDNMYKVAEAMDIYMKEFTDAISANPDDVQSIIKILDDTEIISKWFDEKSGDFVCRVFDAFPGYYENGGAKQTNLNSKKNASYNNAHYYARASFILELGTVNNLNDQGHSKALGLNSAALPNDFTAHVNADAKNGMIPDGVRGTHKNLPGNPYLSTPMQHKPSANVDNDTQSGVAAYEAAQKALKQVSSLKNLVAAFVTIGERFGGKDLISKTHLSPKLLLQYLNDYIAASAFHVHMIGKNIVPNANAVQNVHLGTSSYKINTPFSNAQDTTEAAILRLGFDSRGTGAAATTNMMKYMTVLMRGRQLQGPVPLAPATNLMNEDMFKTSDKLFQLVIKSMTSKILTVIGTFNMFNRPINQNGLGYYSDLRLILGGAEQPSVIPEAFELYIRLPLLAEAYRKIFNFEKPGAEEGGRAISMLPEMDGTFSELIALIFDKARTVDDGNYSDTETRILIESINKIYARFKNSKSPVRDCIEEFIAEVNRRYGIVKNDEREKYNKDRASRYDSKYDSTDSNVDFELDAIDEDDTFVRPSPSDGYRIVKSTTGADATHKHKLDIDGDQKLLNMLRKNIDELLGECKKSIVSQDGLQGLRNVSFQSMINARSHELQHATSDKHKYDIVRNAIASLGTFAVSSLERSYLLFHDTVIAGLSTLRLLFKQLKTYEKTVYDIWYNYDRLRAFVKAQREPARAGRWAGVGGAIAGLPVASIKDYSYAAGNAVAADTQGTDSVIDVAGNNRVINIYNTTNHGAGGQVALNLGQIQALSPDDSDASNLIADKIAEAYLRFSLKQQDMFADLFEAIYNHGETLSDLVSIKLDVSRMEDKPGAKYKYGERKMAVHLDYSKLRERVYSLFNQLKSVFDKFRGLLPDDVLKRYETYAGADGSTLYSLEKHLIDELIEGKYSSDDSDKLKENRTLDGTNRKIKELLDYFTRPWKVSGLTVARGQWNADVESSANAQREFDGFTLHQFTDKIYNIIYPPVAVVVAQANIGNAANPPVLAADKGWLRVLFNTTGKTKHGKAADASWNDVPQHYLDCISSESDWKATGNDLVLSFNKLVSAYLTQVYDDASRTVYAPALNKFVSGSFSSSVMGMKNYNDNAYINDIRFSTAADRSILFRSISVAMRQLMTEKNIAGNELEYAKSDLAQVPTYVKERLRANLPVLQKLFTLLMNRSEMCKKFAVALNVEQQINNAAAAAVVAANNAVTEAILLNTLDQVSYGCQSMIQCCQDVATDLADAPKYMETHADFIQEYENMNGITPMMPHASLLRLMGNAQGAAVDPKFGMPIHTLGNDEFKMLYGTRGLLCKQGHTLADTPAMLKTLKDHNSTTDARHHLTEKDVQAFSNDYVQIAQYCIDARLYNQQFKVGTYDLRADIFTADTKNWVYQLYYQDTATSLAEVLRLTESNFQREERSKLVKHVEQGDSSTAMISGTRLQLIGCNIIDLNIVPINPHALMREMPLVNLYNYAYTFDRMIEEVLDQHNVDAKLGIDEAVLKLGNDADDKVSRADQLLAMLMIRPYKAIDEQVYESLVPRIMRGAIGVEGLGRPKYLGEELYNKALFGEIYSNDTSAALESDAGLAGARNSGAIARNVRILANQLVSRAGFNGGAADDILVTLQHYLIDGMHNGTQVFVGDTRAKRLAAIRRAQFGAANNVTLVADLTAALLAGPGGAAAAAINAAAAANVAAIENMILDFYENNISNLPRASRNISNTLEESNNLHFIDKDARGKAVVKSVDVGNAKDVLKSWGKQRFDTRFVRNLFWIANIQRLLRLKLRRDLTWYNSRVVSSHAAVASGITELYDHDVAQPISMTNYRY
jgi:hypothetical protein